MVRVIPQNTEKSLTVGQLKFIDSFQSTKGLDVLAKTLADDEFRYLTESCTSFWSHPAERCITMTIWIALTDLTRLNYLHRMRS